MVLWLILYILPHRAEAGDHVFLKWTVLELWLYRRCLFYWNLSHALRSRCRWRLLLLCRLWHTLYLLILSFFILCFFLVLCRCRVLSCTRRLLLWFCSGRQPAFCLHFFCTFTGSRAPMRCHMKVSLSLWWWWYCDHRLGILTPESLIRIQFIMDSSWNLAFNVSKHFLILFVLISVLWVDIFHNHFIDRTLV